MKVNAEFYAEYREIFPFRSIRIIPYTLYSGLENMCLDYYLAQNCTCSGMPVLRFYGWRPFCLSLGKHQSDADIDRELLQRSGFDMVRRPTGGNAIFHSQELTYSFIIPGKRLNHQKLFSMFHEYLKAALVQTGYNVSIELQNSAYSLNQGGKSFACFNRAAFSELRCAGKKLAGSAQKLFPESLLQHGSLMLGPEHLRIIQFLKTDDQSRENYLSILEDNSTHLDIWDCHEQGIKDIVGALCEVFEQQGKLHLFYQDFSDQERLEVGTYTPLFKV